MNGSELPPAEPCVSIGDGMLNHVFAAGLVEHSVAEAPVFSMDVRGVYPGPFHARFPRLALVTQRLGDLRAELGQWIDQPLTAWRSRPFEGSYYLSASDGEVLQLIFTPDFWLVDPRSRRNGSTVRYCARSALTELRFRGNPTDLTTFSDQLGEVFARLRPDRK